MKFMVASARLFVAFLVVVSVTSCSHPPAAKRYELQGRVVAVDAAARQLTIAHKDIPGLMEGMTMPFTVSDKDVWVFKSIAPGDEVKATLVLGDQAELQDVTFTRHSDTQGDGTSARRIPQPGDEVPDFMLVNQSGKTIQFQQFRGKPLLLTFIYTRCPFPDYCPRLSNNFAQVMQQLQKDPKAFAAAQLLSISIDPEHDKPADVTHVRRTLCWQGRSQVCALGIRIRFAGASPQSRRLLRSRLQPEGRTDRSRAGHSPDWQGRQSGQGILWKRLETRRSCR